MDNVAIRELVKRIGTNKKNLAAAMAEVARLEQEAKEDADKIGGITTPQVIAAMAEVAAEAVKAPAGDAAKGKKETGDIVSEPEYKAMHEAATKAKNGQPYDATFLKNFLPKGKRLPDKHTDKAKKLGIPVTGEKTKTMYGGLPLAASAAA